MATARVSKTTTLTASTVNSDTLTGSFSAVEIVHHGNAATPIYALLSTAATVPTVAGDDEEVILPGERIRIPGAGANSNTVVSVISAGTPTVTIIGVA